MPPGKCRSPTKHCCSHCTSVVHAAPTAALLGPTVTFPQDVAVAIAIQATAKITRAAALMLQMVPGPGPAVEEPPMAALDTLDRYDPGVKKIVSTRREGPYA